LDALLERARPADPVPGLLPPAPEPYVRPVLEEVLSDSQPAVVVIEAAAAVGKSALAAWLANQCAGHLVDLSRVHVGTYGFLGDLAAHNIADSFRRGSVTVVVDALDEGLLRSGIANFSAYIDNVLTVLSEARMSWPPDAIRLVLLGRDHAANEVAGSLTDGDVPYAYLRLSYFDRDQATELALQWAGRPIQGPARDAVHSFFSAAATALGSTPEDVWNLPAGRGFVGYAPVLRVVAEEIRDNPMAAKAGWDASTSTSWESAWATLVETAYRLLDREQPKISDGLGFAVPAPAYGREHQLKLLCAHLRGLAPDPAEDLRFSSAAEAEQFRVAVAAQLGAHPFLATGVSEILGSLVLGQAIAAGESVTGAEVHLDAYARQPFLWRFFSSARSDARAAVDGDALGWVLASMWDGTTDESWTTITPREGAPKAVISGASPTDVHCVIAGSLRLHGTARSMELDLPDDTVSLTARHGSDGSGSIFVFRGEVLMTGRELAIEAAEILVAQDAVVRLDFQIGPSSVAGVTIRHGGSLAVSRPLYRYPWTVGGLLKTEDDSEASPEILDRFIKLAAETLPNSGLPAFLDKTGRPLDDDENYVGWPKEDRRALGVLMRELEALGAVVKTKQETSGPESAFSYKPQGFVWQDLVHQGRVPALQNVDWTRIARRL
jgi:hypothetical protein